jgi:hypothetical protein
MKGSHNLHYEIIWKFFGNKQIAAQTTHYQPDLHTTKSANSRWTKPAAPNLAPEQQLLIKTS